MDLDPYIAALACAFVVSLALTAGIEWAAPRLPRSWPLGGLRGDGEKAPLGGIALFAAFAIAPFLAVLLSDRADEYLTPKCTEFLGYLGAAGLVFLTGLMDDRHAMRPWQKIAGQLVAGTAVFAAGYRFEAVGLPWGVSFELGVLALPVTLAWVVFFTNALNLIDGIDGLATGVGVFAAASLAAVAANTEHTAVALLFVGLAGAGLGFLPFNLPKASLILGDSGALLFGFVLSTLSIRGATGIENEVFVAVPLLAMGFPVLDTLLSAARRLLDRRHPFSRDHDHIHHRIEVLDLGPRVSLGVLYALSGAFAAAALLTHYVASLVVEAAVLVGLIAVVATVLGRLGYLVSMWNSDRVVSLRRRLAR